MIKDRDQDLNLSKVAEAWAKDLGFVLGGFYPNPATPGEHIKAVGFMIGLDYNGKDYRLLVDGRTLSGEARLIEATKILEHTGAINASYTMLAGATSGRKV